MMLFHGAHRRPYELVFAAYTFGFGIWVAMPTASMATIAYTDIMRQASELQWGVLFMFLGLSHGLSVVANGSRWWTPFSRAATAAMMGTGFAALLAGFWHAVPASTAIPTYLGMVGLSVWCWYQAMKDCGAAWARWKHAGV